MPKVNFSKIPLSFLLMFSLFIVYGTIIPFNLGGIENIPQRIQDICWDPFMANEGGRTSLSDVIQNIFLFIPVGFLGFVSFVNYRSRFFNSLMVLFYGAFLSFSVESLQLFTIDRTTSVTDLITNSLGTIVGILISIVMVQFWIRFRNQRIIMQIFQYPLFIPFLLLLFLISAELLQPFDFALDLRSVISKIINIFHHPISISFTGRDEPFIILLYSTLTYLALQGIKQAKMRIPVWACLSVILTFNFSVESIQLVIRSRNPEVWDILIGTAGIITGFLIYSVKLRGFLNPGTILLGGYIFSFTCKCFYPFRISKSYHKFNWTPFLSEYSYTTMIGLGNTIETCIIFSFGGYIYDKLCRDLSRKTALLILFLVIISISEILQGWMIGRYPDITDILVGFSAFLLGRYVSTNGEQIFAAN